MNNKCTVSSLSEYILAIEKYELFNYISRGEKEAFDCPLSSGICRRNLHDYVKMLDAYHLNVENCISSLQEKNFLAFAQHHGIPTNLLDFSFSPLVSLYFGVDGCKDKGYVYFLKTSKTVDINKVIVQKPLGWGLLRDLLDCDPELYKRLIANMSDAFMASREEMIAFFEEHAEQYISEFKRRNRCHSSVNDFEKILAEYKSDKLRWISEARDVLTLQIYSSAPNFLNAMQGIYKNDMHYPRKFFSNYETISSMVIEGSDRRVNIDIMLFLLKMEAIEHYRSGGARSTLKYGLEFPFYFTYQPPVIDERVKNQASIFVFQPFSSGEYHYNGSPVQIWQKIVPDFIIEIENPNGIRKELDAIGFNLKHIYCDHDSVAKYIVSSMCEQNIS